MTASDDGDTANTSDSNHLQGARTSSSSSNNSEQVSVLLGRYRQLLAELDHFQSLLNKKLRNPQVIEVRQMRSNLISEMRALEKLQKQLEKEKEEEQESTAAGASSDVSRQRSGSGTGWGLGRAGEEEEGKRLQDKAEKTTQIGSTQRVAHALRSSNLPFYEAVWTVTKSSCTGLVSFWKRFYWDSGVAGDARVAVQKKKKKTEWGKIALTSVSDGHAKRPHKDKRKSVMVDIVADDGEEWVKVSTISETRLLFEMAKKGWEADSEAEGSSSDEAGETRAAMGPTRTVLQNYDTDSGTRDSDEDEDEDDDEGGIELIKLAVDMRKAANATRVRYHHPRVRFVIPKIQEGKVLEIDHVLKEIRSHGITVECGSSAPGALLAKPAIDGNLSVAANVQELDLSHLLPRPFKRFTATLNVDCTLLLALVSDLSHFKEIPPAPNRHVAILRQMEIEKQQPLLPTEVWPAMTGHDLVCTREAARRMREIVGVIGTDAEKQRTAMLLGDHPYRDLDRRALLDAYQKSSDYPIPPEWRIPIRTVDAKEDIKMAWVEGKLPPQARHVEEILSEINHSVFFWGWATGTMTITSNRTVVRQIETEIEKNRNGDDQLEGPLVWVCETARSLVGKDKDRKT